MTKRKIYIKCPYCSDKYTKEDLVPHIEDIHDDMIPKGYSAFRVVFDYINNKPAGYNGKCVICGKDSGWNEDKGRYNRICNNPSCKSTYIKQFESSMNSKYGYSRISSTEEGQEKMLSNRKISGTYKFKDGIEKSYVGSYEKNALEFMDKVLHIKSEDIFTPGPTFKYLYNTSGHLYISDMYYQPYNLLIEVKDGGNNPNKRNMKEYREKQLAKEEYIIKNTNYNYIRLTNNDFSQLLAVFMDLKMSMVETSGKDRVIHVNESHLFNEPDIYYNKDKFDSGEINLCFITGLSGSGKSTMGRNMSKDNNTEHYELDDLFCIADKFTLDNLKEYGDLIYSFFKGSGKKYYIGWNYVIDNRIPGSEYEDKLYPDFVNYCKEYSKSHTNKKFVVEGVWIYKNNENNTPLFNPSEFKDYAFYIKGTSSIISNIRATRRDLEEENNKFNRFKYSISNFFKKLKAYSIDEKNINRFRDYFSKINNVNEAMNALNTGYIPGVSGSNCSYIVNYMQNNAFSQGYSHDIKLHNLIIRDDEDKTLKKVDDEFVDSLKIESAYRVNKNPEEMYSIFNKYIGKEVSKHFIYEMVFDHKYYDDEQIALEDVELVLDFKSELSIIESNIKEYLLQKEDILDSVSKELNIIGGEIHGC